MLSFIVGVIFVGMQNQPPSHNLMTSDEAEAYLLFNDWQKEHGREYREVEVFYLHNLGNVLQIPTILH